MVGPKVPWRAYAGGEEVEEEDCPEERNFCWRSARKVNGIRLVRTLRQYQYPCEQQKDWKDERYVPSRRVIRHHEVDVPALRYVVEEVLLPDVGELAVVWRDLGEDRLCR